MLTRSDRPVIQARGLSKAFGTTQALAHVDFEAQAGQVLALLGPNGAGKTTLVRILTTLLKPDGGWATVAGFDVVKDAAYVRPVVGLTGQFAAIDLLLTGRENLEMVGDLCHLPRPRARGRAAELLQEFDLVEAADRVAKTYSGGMRRRLDFAASLIAEPPVLVLDEPTTGLDPRSRANVWAEVDRLVAAGTTVLLTTQYLEEADRLAHHIAVIDRGRIVSEGTSDELKAQLGGDVIEVQLSRADGLSTAVSALSAIEECRSIDPERHRITLPARDGMTTLRAALDRLDRVGVEVEDIGIRRPSLDDVFLALTGHGVEGEISSPNGRVEQSPPPSTATIRAETTTDTGGHTTRDRPRGTVIRDTWTVTKRNLRRITRTPRLLLVSSIQPILYVLLFRFVFGGSLVIPGMTYIDYLLPGIFVTATLMGATTAVAITTDLSGGMIDRFRSLPMARSAVLAGRCLADLVRCVLVVAIVLVVGTVLGFRFHAGPLPALAAIGLVFAAAFAFIWLYALIGLLVKDPETSHLAGFLIVMPFVFASSVFVRVQNMPGWLQIFSRNQPVTVTVDAVRALSEGGPAATFAWQSAAWIVGSVILFVWLAVSLYRRA